MLDLHGGAPYVGLWASIPSPLTAEAAADVARFRGDGFALLTAGGVLLHLQGAPAAARA